MTVDLSRVGANKHDIQQPLHDNVHVAVRVRPLLPREQHLPAAGGGVANSEDGKVTAGDRVFFFDSVFDAHASQEHVFSSTVAPIVESALAGYGGTVFAYGATASGKTYTMGMHADFGTSEKGVLPRVLERLVAEERQSAILTVNFSLLEIYNEEIRDLLRPNTPPLQIREDALGHIHIPNACVARLSRNGLHEAFLTIQRALESRVTGSTLLNDRSSRSHCVLTFTIDRVLASGLSVRAKLNLVDLAGSERQKRTGAFGARLKESASINSGLLALGNVISALTVCTSSSVEGECMPSSHVPYRDSKLTRLLQDALGGSSRCAMIACVSPASADVEETANTLRYAARAKHIKNHPKMTTLLEASDAAEAGAAAAVKEQAFRAVYRKLAGSLGAGDAGNFDAAMEDFRLLVGEEKTTPSPGRSPSVESGAASGSLAEAQLRKSGETPSSSARSSCECEFFPDREAGEKMAYLDEALDAQEETLQELQSRDADWVAANAEFSGRLRELEQELARTKLEVQELGALLQQKESLVEHERALLERKHAEAMQRMERQMHEVSARAEHLNAQLRERRLVQKRVAELEENCRLLRLDRDNLKAELNLKARTATAATRTSSRTPRRPPAVVPAAKPLSQLQPQLQPQASAGAGTGTTEFLSKYQEERERKLRQRRAEELGGEERERLQSEIARLEKHLQNVVKFMTTHCGVQQVSVVEEEEHDSRLCR